MAREYCGESAKYGMAASFSDQRKRRAMREVCKKANEDDNQRIDTVRALTGAQKVTLDRVPKWLKAAVKARCGQWHGVYEACQVLGIDTQWLDHWGASNGKFVSEPYSSSWVVEQAARFAEELGLALHVDCASWWNPPFTIRLEFAAVVQRKDGE